MRRIPYERVRCQILRLTAMQSRKFSTGTIFFLALFLYLAVFPSQLNTNELVQRGDRVGRVDDVLYDQVIH